MKIKSEWQQRQETVVGKAEDTRALKVVVCDFYVEAC